MEEFSQEHCEALSEAVEQAWSTGTGTTHFGAWAVAEVTGYTIGLWRPDAWQNSRERWPVVVGTLKIFEQKQRLQPGAANVVDAVVDFEQGLVDNVDVASLRAFQVLCVS